MRLISQNGRYDLSYEKCVLFVGDKGIIATPIGIPEMDIMMAIYSSKKKIEYVMYNLHQIYSGHAINDDENLMFIETGKTDINMFNEVVPKSKNLVFKFPHEDEINLPDDGTEK